MKNFIILLSFLFVGLSCSSATPVEHLPFSGVKPKPNLDKLQKAYFASGCFWCVEEVFESVKGVEEVISGYSGGNEKNPSYEQVSAGLTGHAEAVEVYYDSTVVSYETLLKVFFYSHDPTTLNRQGPDAGKQYRSVIFFQNEREEMSAKKYVDELLAAKTFAKITTQIVPFQQFYPAESYHQDYIRNNPSNPYVRGVSIPRFNKFKEKAGDLLKE